MTQPSGGSSPETVEYITLEKFSGMNTVQPSGSFGQPNLLENVYLDRRGGYTTSPGNVLIKLFSGKVILGIYPFSGINLVIVRFESADPNTTSISALKLSTGAEIFSTTTGYESVATYKSGIVASWKYGATNGGIQLFTADYSTVITAGDPVVNVSEVNKRVAITVTYADSANYGTAPSGSLPFSYAKDTLMGFDPDKQTYVFLYVQEWPEPASPVTGTTLNPAPPKPRRIAPTIVEFGALPGANAREFKLVINNPSNLQIYAFGETSPSKRPFEEWRNNFQTRTNSASYAAGKVVSYLVGSTGVHQYQAMNTGITGATEPDVKNLPTTYGSSFIDGQVTFTCLGTAGARYLDTVPEFMAHVGGAPIGYLLPELVLPETEVQFADFGQLTTVKVGSTLEVYRSAKDNPDDFTAASFFPLGSIAESHLGRTWVVADSTWRTYAVGAANTGSPVQIQQDRWERTKQRQTVYYSEAGVPWSFLERYIVLPLVKSVNIVAMHSIGDYLLFLGDADGVVLSGDAEANFFAKGIDIPGGYAQNLGIVVNGVLYYRGVGGIYRMNGGTAERISDDVSNLIPDVLGSDEAVSRDDTHIHFQISLVLTLTYDIISNGWTTQQITGNRFVNAGEVSLNYNYATVYKMTGTPDRASTIKYEGMELAVKMHRLHLKTGSFYADGSGSADMQVLAHTQQGLGSFTPSQAHLVNQTGQYMQWRFRSVVGHSFDMTIKLIPNNGAVTLKPGVNLEVYKAEVLRRGYNG